MFQLAGSDLDRDCSGGTAGGEIRLVHRGYAGGAIDVGHIGDVDDVDVVDLHMDHGGFVDVGDVDLVDVLGSAGVPGAIGFSGTERKPDGDAAAAKLDASGEDDLCGRPDGMAFAGSGNPAPAAADYDPASVMERSCAQGSSATQVQP